MQFQKAFLLFLLFLTPVFALRLEGVGCSEYKPKAKREALRDILNQACEYGGVDVKSITRVENLTFQNMLLFKKCSSKVKLKNIHYQLDLNASKGNVVCVKAYAEVEKVDNKLNSYGLKISLEDPQTGSPKYSVTEEGILKVNLFTKRPCYAYVFEVSPKDFVGKVIPEEGANNLLKGNAFFYYQAVSYERKYPQRWYLVFLCTSKRFKELERIPPFDVNLKLGYFKRFTFKDLENVLVNIPAEDWDISFTSFDIVK